MVVPRTLKGRPNDDVHVVVPTHAGIPRIRPLPGERGFERSIPRVARRVAGATAPLHPRLQPVAPQGRGKWCRGPLRPDLPGVASIRGIAAGFDSGDVLLIDIRRAE